MKALLDKIANSVPSLTATERALLRSAHQHPAVKQFEVDVEKGKLDKRRSLVAERNALPRTCPIGSAEQEAQGRKLIKRSEELRAELVKVTADLNALNCAGYARQIRHDSEHERINNELRMTAHPLLHSAWSTVRSFTPNACQPALMVMELPGYDDMGNVNFRGDRILIRDMERWTAMRDLHTGVKTRIDEMLVSAMAEDLIRSEIDVLLADLNKATATFTSDPFYRDGDTVKRGRPPVLTAPVPETATAGE